MEKANSLRKTTVGIGRVCVETGVVEMTAYAIGSCIALCLYDSVTAMGAMAHILLPAKSYTGHENPHIDIDTKYADHAIACALGRMESLGVKRKNIKAAIVGGATMFPHGDVKTLNIGQMNEASVRQELEKNEIPIVFAVTGGEKSRTVTFRIPGGSMEQLVRVR